MSASSHVLFFAKTVFASQVLLEAFFYSRGTISLLWVKGANGAAAQTAEGFGAAVDIREVNATLVITTANEGQLFNGFLLCIGHAGVGQTGITFASSPATVGGDHFLAVICGTLVA